MYPIFRFIKHMAAARRMPPLTPFEPHISHHRCWPWDIDPWMEMNNGRTLTLYDLGRIALSLRTGLAHTARTQRWGLAVAGVSVRYRRRIKAFERFDMVSRLVGWDERFFYMEQSMWKGSECANNMLLRSAVTRGASGIVPVAEVAAAMALSPESPPLPEWVRAWIAADAQRPWPP